MTTLNVAVTGVGGASGQSVMKALFMAKVRDQNNDPVSVEIYPVDVQPFSAGLYRGRHPGTVLPKPEENIQAWEKWVAENEIQVVIPGADRDLPPLAAVRGKWLSQGTMVIVSDPGLIEMANDKLFTVDELGTLGFGVPMFVVPSRDGVFDDRDLSATLKANGAVVVKPRCDAASRGVYICHTLEEIRFWIERIENPAIQERLEGPELTCGVFTDKNTHTAIFMAKRELYAGSTYLAEVGWWPELETTLRDLGEVFRPMGPMNVQLILTEDGPKVFEINARMSGSSAIRAYFGFNEAEMALNHFVYGHPINPRAQYKTGFAMRYWDELYIDNVQGWEIEAQRGQVQFKGKIPSWL